MDPKWSLGTDFPIIEQGCEKTCFGIYAKTKAQISLRSDCAADPHLWFCYILECTLLSK